MPLTDVAIRNTKAGSKVQKLSDGDGLQLWITPANTRSWNLAYRFSGKQKKLHIGSYPEISLKAARTRADEARDILAKGIDPSQQKKQDEANKARDEANTFALIAAELLDKKKREGKASNTIGKREWLYSLAGDAFQNRPIAEIGAHDVLSVLRTVEARGHLETARRLRSSIGEVFRFAIATQRATIDPTAMLRGALAQPKVTHRAALLEPKALGGLMRAIEAFQGQPTTIAALKLMAYLFPRPGELRMAEWTEFDFEARVWTIPAARMKMRREHRVPLPQQAIDVLEALRAVTPQSALVFPGLANPKRPLSENTLNSALRRMGYGPDEMTSHGFRASASTLLNESRKFSADAIERALAHQEADAVRRTYARGEHWDERVKMATWWADYLDNLRDGAKVVTMKRG